MTGNVWNGEAVKRQVIEASMRGVNKTMADCVIEAKSNHPGWKNVTGTAEGSIRIQSFAQEAGRDVFGLWGSINVVYMKYLEWLHGSALRNAADRCYPRLKRYIRESMT